jgi:DNA-binding MarR family transcriptional regulator
MGLIGTIFLDWRRYRQQALLPFGASLKHYHVLRQLDRREHLNPSEIARMLYCDRPTATVIITTMENRGWVVRERDPEDGKRILVSITPQGRQKLAEIRASGYLDPQFDPLEVLDKEEIAALRRTLAKMRRHIAALSKDQGPDDMDV